MNFQRISKAIAAFIGGAGGTGPIYFMLPDSVSAIVPGWLLFAAPFVNGLIAGVITYIAPPND